LRPPHPLGLQVVDDGGEQSAEARRGGRASGHHLSVRQRLLGYTSGVVGHAGDAQHPATKVSNGDHLGHGGHAAHVSAQRTLHADFGWCLVGRAGHGDVDTLPQIHVQRMSGGQSDLAKRAVVGLGHVRETRTALTLVVLADERVAVHEVDVITDDDQLARLDLRIHAAAGAGDDVVLHPSEHERPHGEYHGLVAVPLVAMDATVQDQHPETADLHVAQDAGMASGPALGKTKLGVADFPRARQISAVPTQT